MFLQLKRSAEKGQFHIHGSQDCQQEREKKPRKPALCVFLSPHCSLHCSCLSAFHKVPLNLGLRLSISRIIFFSMPVDIYYMISGQNPRTLLLPKCTAAQNNWALFLQIKLPVKPRAVLGARGMLVCLLGALITSLCLHSTERRVTIHLEKHFLYLMQKTHRKLLHKNTGRQYNGNGLSLYSQMLKATFCRYIHIPLENFIAV